MERGDRTRHRVLFAAPPPETKLATAERHEPNPNAIPNPHTQTPQQHCKTRRLKSNTFKDSSGVSRKRLGFCILNHREHGEHRGIGLGVFRFHHAGSVLSGSLWLDSSSVEVVIPRRLKSALRLRLPYPIPPILMRGSTESVFMRSVQTRNYISSPRALRPSAISAPLR